MIVRYALVLLGAVLCGTGLVQVQEGVPIHYHSRGIADLQADANAILLGIAWLMGGLASGVFALAFPGIRDQGAEPAGRRGGLSPPPSGG